MNMRLPLGSLLVVALAAPSALASITIDSFNFDLNQFTGAAVTYRADADGGTVTFDGKLWDNEVGVDGVTTGELAAGQFGSDPGDQLSLNNRSTPDWFQLTYAGAGLTIGDSTQDTFVIYEITSSNTGVDTEGTSWKISFNGGTLNDASTGTASFLDFSSQGVENVNQIAFDLTSFGFSSGDLLKSVYIENIDSGSGTSDPDFIFTALEGTLVPGGVIPEFSSVATWTLLSLAFSSWAYRRRRSATL